MGTLRVVSDTNVLISALGWDAKPEACLEQVFHDQVEGYISPAILDELTRVMEYPRFEFTDDDKILECAIASNADYIVSGDSHLQELGSYRTVEIVNPAEFFDITDKKPDE